MSIDPKVIEENAKRLMHGKEKIWTIWGVVDLEGMKKLLAPGNEWGLLNALAPKKDK